MKSLSGVEYVRGAAYVAGISSTSAKRFVEWLKPELQDIPFSKEKVMERINQILEKYNLQKISIVNEKYATWFCILKDLEKIKALLERGAYVEDPLENIEEVYEQLCSVVEKEFPEFETPELKIVEKLPPPYDKMNWYACAPDREDLEMYGIEPGIYVKKSLILPYFTYLLIAHELTHKIVEHFGTYGFGIGLEEGIADFYGAYLAARVIDSEIVANVLIFDRKYGARTRSSALYDFFGTIVYEKIYKPYGMEGVRAVIRMGRTGIRQLGEIILDNGEFELPKGDWDKTAEKVFERYTRFPNDLYASPAAKYISYHIHPRVTIDELREKTKMPKELLDTALRELQSLALITIHGGKITAAAQDMLKRLRYDIPRR